ncbi:DNA-binding LytR/AlgR family response regulator [Wenyingzhuangia heitensis]|uniref:DNA-binding LytR/AlgR family response regulator n=1 Tax=Wenyingzhuangia heitensis TaxID=1487859 RepID=A0ABX0UC47_9FLAO|nr:LytTR family DNA-binding domain-containing protein [Wenyingzhuangia heitensis]NIJ46409.1 DNA-binding LytR/AlgR family response regulator [Wenyingzhuangia heitensis]
MATKMIKCIIVDDEPAAHYVLTDYINKSSSLTLVHQLYNGTNTIAYLENNSVDLMFLDIDMPDITGLELLQKVDNPPKTILTTAYSEFALKAYDHGVIDYLLKPIFYPRFLKAIEHLNQKSKGLLSETVPKHPEFINLKIGSDFVDIPLSDILFLQSYGNYVKVYTMKRIYVATTTTSELERTLPSELFVRTHKSYIIAVQKVCKIDKDVIQIKKETIPIGITYKRNLFEKLDYSES